MMQVPQIKVEMVPPWAWALIAGAGVYVAWQLKNKGIDGVTAGIIGGTADAAGGLAVGVVKGVGQAVGVPNTDTANCQASLDAGDTWAASFYCPAGTFLRDLVTPKARKPKATSVKPAGQASPAVGGVNLDGSVDLSSVTGAGPSFQDLSTIPEPIFDVQQWTNERNGKVIVPVAGIRG